MGTRSAEPGEILNGLLSASGVPRLSVEQLVQFEGYLSLFLRWNMRTNLSAVRETEAILARHFVESIVCARALPQGISTLLDFGSGGGLPGIPIAICRPEISVTLAESQGKKTAFLQEAVRTIGISAKVYAGRAETLSSSFDCVTLRAVDKMAEAVSAATELVNEGGWLALMTTHADEPKLRAAAGEEFAWSPAVSLARSDERILVLAKKS